jgi:hypothetical protein
VAARSENAKIFAHAQNLRFGVQCLSESVLEKHLDWDATLALD